jgi:hypothetical protein
MSVGLYLCWCLCFHLPLCICLYLFCTLPLTLYVVGLFVLLDSSSSSQTSSGGTVMLDQRCSAAQTPSMTRMEMIPRSTPVSERGMEGGREGGGEGGKWWLRYTLLFVICEVNNCHIQCTARIMITIDHDMRNIHIYNKTFTRLTRHRMSLSPPLDKMNSDDRPSGESLKPPTAPQGMSMHNQHSITEGLITQQTPKTKSRNSVMNMFKRKESGVLVQEGSSVSSALHTSDTAAATSTQRLFMEGYLSKMGDKG